MKALMLAMGMMMIIAGCGTSDPFVRAPEFTPSHHEHHKNKHHKNHHKHDQKMPYHHKHIDKMEHKKMNKASTCLDARRTMRGFKVLSPHRVEVDYGRHDYVVTVQSSCDLRGAERLSFSQMPERATFINGRTIYATQLQNGMICGKALDSVVMRERGDDFYTMGHSCRIESVTEVE